MKEGMREFLGLMAAIYGLSLVIVVTATGIVWVGAKLFAG